MKIVTIKEVVDWIEVASFAEAWIENLKMFKNPLPALSPPSRRRGLKNYTNHPIIVFGQSRLLRGGVD